MMNDRANQDRQGPIDRMLGRLSEATNVICGVAMVTLTVIFGWLVFGRYVLNATPTWVEQVSLLLVVLITFLGSAVGIREETHLGVSFLRDVSAPAVRLVLVLVGHVAMAVFGVTMAIQGGILTAFKWGSDIPLLNVPEGLRAMPVAVGGALIALFSLGHILSLLRSRLRGAKIP